jgi:hypothetical protein
MLHKKGVAFAFVSGSSPEELPDELRAVPFIPKPYRPSDIAQVLTRRIAGVNVP